MPTHSRAAADLRAARAAVFALVCVTLSAAGHVAASDRMVPAWALGTAWVGVWLLAMGLAGRERSLPGITVAMLTGQLALHTLFGLGQGAAHGGHSRSELEQVAVQLLCRPHGAGMHPGSTLPRGTDAAAVVREAGLDPRAYAQAAPDSAAGLCSGLTSSPSMLVGHLLAGLVAGWLLRRGEVALWRLVRLTARMAEVSAFPLRTALALLRAVLGGLPTPVACGGPRGGETGPAELVPVLLQHSVVRRGPPGFGLAA